MSIFSFTFVVNFNNLLIQWGTVLVNYNNTNTVVTMPVGYTTTYHTVCELGNAPGSGVAQHSINREYNTETQFNIWGDYSSDRIINVPTSWVSIGF